jgi:hypothetical protein
VIYSSLKKKLNLLLYFASYDYLKCVKISIFLFSCSYIVKVPKLSNVQIRFCFTLWESTLLMYLSFKQRAGHLILLMDTTLNAPDNPCHPYSVCSPHYLRLLNSKTAFAIYQIKLNWAARYRLCLSTVFCAWQSTIKCNALLLWVILFPYTYLFGSFTVNSVTKYCYSLFQCCFYSLASLNLRMKHTCLTPFIVYIHVMLYLFETFVQVLFKHNIIVTYKKTSYVLQCTLNFLAFLCIH